MIEIKLRELKPKDEALVIEMLGDANVMQFIGPRRPLGKEEAKQWFIDTLADPSRFVIAAVKNDEFIGFCGVKEIDGVQDFGYFLRQKYWGKGVVTEACRLAVHQIKDQLDVREFEVFIADDNVASRRVAEKLGWAIQKNGYKNDEHGSYYQVST